jgi:hypothetical protein
MKTLLLIILVCLFTSVSAQQKVKTDAKGNYIVATQTVKGSDQKTGKTFTDSKGKVYQVFTSSRGNLYYLKVSAKTGKEYKVYIKN